MKRLLALLLLCALTFGCAWSRGRIQHLDSDGVVLDDIHCWTIVLGKGHLGATCTDETATLATKDTGISENGVKAIEKAVEAAIRGLKLSGGLP